MVRFAAELALVVAVRTVATEVAVTVTGITGLIIHLGGKGHLLLPVPITIFPMVLGRGDHGSWTKLSRVGRAITVVE